jgi:2-polyprenyl-3-methyl-5-hydroxy-6-metoxy-1,4-benzoquinol methylase
LLRSRDVTQVTGVDISQLAVESCREKEISAIQEDITNKSFVERLPQFVYVILADIIEHLAHPEDIILALKGKFRKGIIVTTLNTGYIQYRLRLLFGKFAMQWRIFLGEYLRFWTLSEFRWWIDKLDFLIEEFVPMFGIPILKKVWPNLFCQQTLFLLKER